MNLYISAPKNLLYFSLLISFFCGQSRFLLQRAHTARERGLRKGKRFFIHAFLRIRDCGKIYFQKAAAFYKIKSPIPKGTEQTSAVPPWFPAFRALIGAVTCAHVFSYCIFQKRGSGVNLRNALNLRELTAGDSLSLKESRFLLAPSLPLHLFPILSAFFFTVK